MKVKDLIFKNKLCTDNDILLSCDTEYGEITILTRELDKYCHVTETGFYNNKGVFYLTPSEFDIRDYPDISVKKAISIIIKKSLEVW